jgi:hypothetical protein
MKYLKKFNEDFAMSNNAEEMEGIDPPKECEKCGKPHDFCECETAQHGGEACEGCGHKECVCEYERHSEGRIARFDEKMNAGLRAYLDKKAGKKGKKSDKEDDKDDKKSDKKDDKKSDKKNDKEEKSSKGKGLTAAQKKLPAGLQKAILAKKK